MMTASTQNTIIPIFKVAFLHSFEADPSLLPYRDPQHDLQMQYDTPTDTFQTTTPTAATAPATVLKVVSSPSSTTPFPSPLPHRPAVPWRFHH